MLQRFRIMPPKVIGSRGCAINRGRVAHRIRLSDDGRPCRDPAFPPSPPEEVADHDELYEGRDEHGDSASHCIISGAYVAPPVPAVAPLVPPTAPSVPLTAAPLIQPKVSTTPFQLSLDLGAFMAQMGLHVEIRASMTWFKGSNFRELVEAALNIEKVKQEEKEYEQKIRHLKRNYPLIVAKYSASGEGSIAPGSVQIGTTPPRGRYITDAGSSMSRASGAISTAQSRPITQPSRPCTQARAFSMT
ncbi:hypothetical protein GH714_006257 [Hevea brasiliensis]|uniref:Uncharacterized protein n=1 Tax=Hevea brasiliensis TaxID=3981 RepID=A0A6A6NBY4_HEVBR|nr:hypothetical protein GH714_006257 [Hevea brasiliensis]